MPQKTPRLTHTHDALVSPSSQELKQGDESIVLSSTLNHTSPDSLLEGEPIVITAAPDAATESVMSSASITDSHTILSKTEASAEELMDSVFEDVDYMLDKGVSLVPISAPEPTPEPTPELAPEPIEPIASAPTANTGQGLVHQDTVAIATEEPIDSDSAALDELASFIQDPSEDESSPVPSDPDTEQAWGRAINMTLPILGACAALGVALAAGFVLHSPSSPWNRGAIANAGSQNALEGTGEFASYMQRALDTIARSETSVSALAERGLDDDDDNTPPDLPLTSSTTNNLRAPSIPQRVYIPVYQPSSPSVSPLPSVSAPLNGTTTPEASTTPAPSSSPTAAPVAASPAPVASPSPSPTSTTSLPTVSVASTPAPAISPTPSTPAPAIPPAPAPSAPVLSELSHDHVLVGLLQLGDRSVAMFDFSEGTHRVKVGEQIGNSGWSLVSVSQNEAVIRRNGDVRSIYIGQSF